MSSLVSEVDELYMGCVMEPEEWTDQAFVDWSSSVASNHEIDRNAARLVRRTVNAAAKLRAFWLAHDAKDDSMSWQARVDLAMGPRAWRPALDLAELELSVTSSPESFARVTDLFPLVRNQPFMDGIGYEMWLDSRPDL